MDLEKLTKTQIILLTLLVSFVTSIATGIVTVTLMDQAPPGVSHTINRVVERTVERVVPPKNNAAVSQTVVVESDEKIANAVAQNKQSVVRLYEMLQVEPATSTQETAEKETKEMFTALGFVASQEGLIVTDSAAVSSGGVYSARLPEGDTLPAEVIKQDEEKGVALLELSLPEAGGVSLSPVSFGSAAALSLGQTVLALIGEHNTTLSEGLVTGFEEKEREIETEKGETKTETYREMIHTSVSLDAYGSGSVLFTIEGDIVGMNLARSGGVRAVTAEAITDMITAMNDPKEESSNTEKDPDTSSR